MKTCQQGSHTERLVIVAVLVLLLSGIYVPAQTSLSHSATKTSQTSAANQHLETPSIAKVVPESVHAPVSQARPSTPKSERSNDKPVQNAVHSKTPSVHIGATPVAPTQNSASALPVENETSPASAVTPVTSSTPTNSTSASTSAKPAFQARTMTPLVCAMTVSADPLGDFENQQVTFTASGCTPPAGFYWTWGNLPPNCVTQNSGTLSCSPTGSGVFDTFASIISSGGSEYANANTEITVYTDLAVTSPSTPVDTGMSYNLSVSPTSDSVGDIGYFYYYQWSNLPPGCSDNSGTGGGVSTGEPWSDCNTGTSGTYSPSLTVVYSNGESITSTASVTISSPPVPTLDAPSFPDQGQSFTMSVSVTGGSAPLEYQWLADGGSFGSYFSDCPTAILPSGSSTTPPWSTDYSITCTASYIGNINTLVRVEDAAGKTAATSGTYQFTVYQDPEVSLSESRANLDVGQKVWFNSTASYGSGGYKYVYSNLPTGCQSSSTASLSCTPSGPGSSTVSVVVTDSDKMSTPAATATVDVSSDPEITAFSAAPASGDIDVNQTTNFTVTVVDGYGSYSYSWSGLPTGCGTSSNAVLECTPSASGTFSVVATVEDSNKYSVASSPLSFTVDRDPVTTAPKLSRPSIDDYQTINITEAATAQAGGLSYTWEGLPSGCTTQNLAVLSCRPTSWTGTATVYALVGDANGYKAKSPSVTFTVYPLPQAQPPLSVNRNTNGTTATADAGQLVTFIEIDVLGGGEGSGGDTNLWTESGSGMGCSVSTGLELNCTPTAGGNYNVTFTVTDSNGGTASSTVEYTVYNDPQLTTPGLTPGSPDVNVKTLFQTSVLYGSGGLAYVWSGLPSGCTSTNASSFTCAPSRPGYSSVTVKVTDSNGYSAVSAPTRVVIYNSPLVTLQANRTNLDSHESLLFWANATGGTGTFTYTYNGLPLGCSSTNTSALVCSPTATGTFTVNVTVTDTGGGRATSTNVSFSVYKDPIDTYWYWGGEPIAYANESLDIQVNYTGGSGAYDMCFWAPSGWPLDPDCSGWMGGSNFSWMNVHYGVAGTYPIKVSLLDSDGWNTTLQWNQTVYWPIMVVTPSVSSAHQGFSTNATFSIYNLHGAIPLTWWLNDSTRGSTLCGPVTTSTYGTQQCTFVPTWNGTDKLNLTVADSLHSRLFVTFTYTVTQDLGSLALSAKAGNYSAVQKGTLQDEVGATTTFLASYAGGSAPYTCTLTENGTGTIALWSSSTTSCSTTYTWGHVGIYTLNLTVKDSLGGSGGSDREGLTVDVTAPVSVTSVTPALTSFDAQVTDNVSAKISAGLPAFAYSWDFGNGVTKTTSQPWVLYAWPSSGTFTVKVTVTDGTGTSSSKSVQVQVIADPAAKVMSVVDGPISTTGTISGGSTTLPSGTTATFNLTFAGGVGPYTIVWELNGTSANKTTVFGLWTSFSLDWSSTGNHSLTVTITDSEGQSSTFTLSVNVIVDTVGPVTLTISRSVVDSGMWANATASATGGWAPFTYDWLIASASGNRWVNGSVDALNAAWTSSGSYTITAAVVDAFGFKASDTTKLTVNAVPTAPCAPQLVSGIPMAGNALTFSLGCVSGGTGQLLYTWNLGGALQLTGAPKVTVTFHQADTYEISVNVTDEFGVMAASKVLTLGTVPPSIGNATYELLSLSHSEIGNETVYQVELEFAFQMSDTDGTVTGYRYSTNVSNPSALPWVPMSERVANLTLTGSVIQQLYIEVIDSFNRTSSPYTLALNLTSTQSGKGPTVGGTDWGLTFLLIVVAVVVALLAVFAFMEFRKRRRSGGQQVTTTEGSSENSVAKAITDHLNENPNEEEAALVHQVVSKTGATEATVRTQLSILDASHRVEKTETGGANRYSNAAGEVPREELARMGMITDTIRSTVRNETPVAGRRLKEVLKPYNLSEGEIRNYLLDLRSEVTWDPEADFSDFDSVVFRATPAAPETPMPQPDVKVDEEALTTFQRLLGGSGRKPRNGKRKQSKPSPEQFQV